jgi:hypothetical protein
MLLAAGIAASSVPSVQQFYVSAIDAMSGLPQPEYVTYRMDGTSEGLPIGLIVQNGNLWLNVGGGGSTSSWSIRHRTFDYRSVVTDDADGKEYVTERSFFDPTWFGTERALRKGMLDSQDQAPPRQLNPKTDPTPPPDLKTIAMTSVMSPSLYHIADRGPATCANGDPGHALHLWPRDRSHFHQLSDVIVDTRSMRFCMMRYSITGLIGFYGVVEQHFADVGGYWMQTDGFLDGTIRVLGISFHHGVWRYKLDDMQFPNELEMSLPALRAANREAVLLRPRR